jgi:hypothetical protein
MYIPRPDSQRGARRRYFGLGHRDGCRNGLVDCENSFACLTFCSIWESLGTWVFLQLHHSHSGHQFGTLERRSILAFALSFASNPLRFSLWSSLVRNFNDVPGFRVWSRTGILAAFSGCMALEHLLRSSSSYLRSRTHMWLQWKFFGERVRIHGRLEWFSNAACGGDIGVVGNWLLSIQLVRDNQYSVCYCYPPSSRHHNNQYPANENEER